MTDRLKGCVVAFEDDIREDDAAQLLAAIRQLRGVVHVAGNVVKPEDWMNRARARAEITGKIWAVIESVNT